MRWPDKRWLVDVHVYGGLVVIGVGASLFHPAAGWLTVGAGLFYLGAFWRG